MIGEPFNEGAPSRPTKAKGRRPRDGRGVPPVASLRKYRRTPIYARTVPKGSPSEAVTISSPERRMYAHFLGRDCFCLSGKPGTEGSPPRATGNGSGIQVSHRGGKSATKPKACARITAIIPRVIEGKSECERRSAKLCVRPARACNGTVPAAPARRAEQRIRARLSPSMETRMTTHRFRVGQKVQLSRGYPFRMAADGFYEVVRQLPDNAGEFYYRIKSSREAHERVAKESELEKA
jgi:hypothetical protein